MNWMVSLLIVVQVICAVSIIVLVLLQHGKGADMGAAFGSGASGSLFGASGSANFLSRTTGWLAAVFFCATVGLAWTSNHLRTPQAPAGGVMSTMGAGETKPPAATPGSEVPTDAVPAPGAVPSPSAAPRPPTDIPK